MANQIKKTRGLYLRGRTWYYNVTENGREVRRSTRTTSKAAAIIELNAAVTLRNAGHSILERKRPDSILTFGALCDHFYQVHLSHKRMNGSANMIAIWKKGIGANTLLKNISSLTIQQFFAAHVIHCKAIGRGFCDDSFNRHLTGIKAMYTRGLKDRWITGHNPVANITRKPVPIGRVRFLTIDEVTRLLGDALTPLWLQEAMTMALHTGCRAGEMQALRWDSVNLTERVITIKMAKSGKGRQLDIDDTLLAVLKRRHAARKGSLVFSSPQFGPESPMKNASGTSFRLALKRAGISNFRWNDLRHTFASHLVMAGVDLATVMVCMGHSNMTMTLRYAHLAPSHIKKQVRRLDQVFAGQPVHGTSPEGQPTQSPTHSPENAK